MTTLAAHAVDEMVGTFKFPTRVEFGVGVVARLPEFLSDLGVRCPMIVTDQGLARTPVLEAVIDPLRRAGMTYVVFDGVEPNPTEKSVLPGAELYRNHGCDGIVGVGGGSPLDAAKAIALAVNNHEPLEVYDDLTDGWKRITGDIPPQVAIATTAGTGSEVSRSSVIHLASNGRKTVLFSPKLLASIAIADPALTVGLPRHLTAYTGADALTHNIEAYLARGFHPIADAIALRGVQLCGQYLHRAVEQGDDLEARSWMLVASMMGAIAFQKGLGATHSLAHPLSAVCGLHHGMANAIMLPHVLEFNRPCATSRIADIARTLGVASRGSEDDLARAGIQAIAAMMHDIGVPNRLSDVGVGEEHIAAMIPQAVIDGCHPSNPRPCTAEDFDRLFRAAL